MKNILLNFLGYILKQSAKAIIWRYRPDVIAITGSVGKTSAKETIYAVLSAQRGSASGGKNYRRVRKSSGNMNNELGVPLAIIGDWSENELKLVSRAMPPGKYKIKKLFFWLRVILSAFTLPSFLRKFGRVNPRRSAYPEILILEYGADKPGDIRYLMGIAKPKIAIVTAIGEMPVHVEFYSGPDAVAREKAKLVEHLFVNDSAILNFDDQTVMAIKERTRATVKTFGFNEGADVRITNYEIKADGISFKLEYQGNVMPVWLKNVFGKAQAYSAAIAACVGLIYNLNLVEISEALSANYKPVKGRMNLIKGVKDTYIIDDSYNASPLSMQAALETIRDLHAARKIAVLGDMLELGKYSIEAHEAIGKLAAGTADILLTVGPRGKFIAESALKNGMPKNHVLSFDMAEESAKEVQELLRKGDLVLIKASRAIGLEKVVDEIKAAPIV